LAAKKNKKRKKNGFTVFVKLVLRATTAKRSLLELFNGVVALQGESG